MSSDEFWLRVRAILRPLPLPLRPFFCACSVTVIICLAHLFSPFQKSDYPSNLLLLAGIRTSLLAKLPTLYVLLSEVPLGLSSPSILADYGVTPQEWTQVSVDILPSLTWKPIPVVPRSLAQILGSGPRGGVSPSLLHLSPRGRNDDLFLAC